MQSHLHESTVILILHLLLQAFLCLPVPCCLSQSWPLAPDSKESRSESDASSDLSEIFSDNGPDSDTRSNSEDSDEEDEPDDDTFDDEG